MKIIEGDCSLIPAALSLLFCSTDLLYLKITLMLKLIYPFFKFSNKSKLLQNYLSKEPMRVKIKHEKCTKRYSGITVYCLNLTEFSTASEEHLFPFMVLPHQGNLRLRTVSSLCGKLYVDVSVFLSLGILTISKLRKGWLRGWTINIIESPVLTS